MWEKEKLLVTSNFSFPHSVFKRLLWQAGKNQGFEITVGKGEIARHKQFLLFPQCFQKTYTAGR